MFIHPNFVKSMKTGITVTCPGSIIELSNTPKIIFLYLKFRHANAYAAIVVLTTVPITEKNVIIIEFIRKRVKWNSVNADL